jgi:hypothetical protein
MTTQGEPDSKTPAVEPGTEGQRYRGHRRAERNRRLAEAAKRYHGLMCGEEDKSAASAGPS